MNQSPKECNRLDVLELTNELRNEENWDALRNLVIKKGLALSDVALMSFVESEDNIEYGLLVALENVFEFQRADDDSESFLKWKKSANAEGDYDDRSEEVKWTREMLINGDV